MKQRLLLVWSMVLLSTTAPAQTEPAASAPNDQITRLIQEREQLVRQYEEANAQRNALLANKPSKKDLQEVIDALKGIIRKDTEIVQALKATELRRTADIVSRQRQAEQQATVAQTDQSSTRQRFYDLENQIQDLQLRQKQREKQLRDYQAAAQEAQDARLSRELLAAGLAVLCIGLLVYVLRLRQRAGSAPARRKARR
ncbi:hypothetical protein [Hymenobacter latericus]|uniref:hypothetical protein n=1 Tax=Hymenobacter sp. YIM 151858-1 TaxID=2987688 RepID=UPI002225C43A|nr:hypothetical protein [Hymenobacter sp. YIM 151858-1]UYZ60015.1 hypothetical protein OIS50_04265 [Hymenobacter sp. YIM 151858-1]